MEAMPAVGKVVRRVVDEYQHCGAMAFCYGQGSLLSGLASDSDIDIVMIWADGVPSRSMRPARAIASPGFDPVQYDGSFGGLDSLHVDGWPVDVAHYTHNEFERWVGAVRAGNGWQQKEAWPSPLFAVSGFAYGEIVADDRGAAHAARVQLESFPTDLYDKARVHLDHMWPGVRAELLGCVRRLDGWLFHDLAGDVLRSAYITWFAAHHRYCPFPKRTAAWAQRFGLEPELTDVERRIWHTATLGERLALITDFVGGIAERGAPVSGGRPGLAGP